MPTLSDFAKKAIVWLPLNQFGWGDMELLSRGTIARLFSVPKRSHSPIDPPANHNQCHHLNVRFNEKDGSAVVRCQDTAVIGSEGFLCAYHKRVLLRKGKGAVRDVDFEAIQAVLTREWHALHNQPREVVRLTAKGRTIQFVAGTRMASDPDRVYIPDIEFISADFG